MGWLRWLVLAVGLAACGIDGAPERPPSLPGEEDRGPAGSVTVSGDARIGAVGRF